MRNPRFAFFGSPRSVSPWLLHSISKIGTFDAICGPDAEREANRLNARWAFSNLSEMLHETEPDGVILACPMSERMARIKECLSERASVLVLGPPSLNAFKGLSSFAKLSERFVLAAPAIRFAPASLLARRLMQSGEISLPVSIRIESTRRGYERDPSEGFGPISADHVFEVVDLIHYLIGSIQRVFSLAHPEGSLVVSAVGPRGVPISMVFHSAGTAEAVGIELEIRSSDGTRLNLNRECDLTCGSGSRMSAVHRTTLCSLDPSLELGYDGLIAEFRRLIEAERGGVGLIGAVGALADVSKAIFQSAERGHPIEPKASRVQVAAA